MKPGTIENRSGVVMGFPFREPWNSFGRATARLRANIHYFRGVKP